MLYLVLKALHVTAVVAWLGGMIWAPLLLARDLGPEGRTAVRAGLVRLTAPAMIVTLALGLWLAQDAGWFRADWLQLKLVLVLVLTGLHGLIAGQARALAADPARPVPGFVAVLPWAVLACVAGIAVLAIAKPGG